MCVERESVPLETDTKHHVLQKGGREIPTPPSAKYDKGLCSHFCRLTFWPGHITQNPLVTPHSVSPSFPPRMLQLYLWEILTWTLTTFSCQSWSYLVSDWALFLAISYFYLNLLESRFQNAVRTQVVHIIFSYRNRANMPPFTSKLHFGLHYIC